MPLPPNSSRSQAAKAKMVSAVKTVTSNAGRQSSSDTTRAVTIMPSAWGVAGAPGAQVPCGYGPVAKYPGPCLCDIDCPH